MELKQSIFRAYDIRGVVGEDLNEEIAMQIGYGFATYLAELNPSHQLHIIVGRDNRPSGEALSKAFRTGAEFAGVRVFDLGESPSPFLYFANCDGMYDGGCNITASHNPAKYNGFKLVGESAHSICGQELQVIYELAKNAPLEEIKKFEFADDKAETEDIFDDYESVLTNLITLPKKIKVVIDCAGGVATGRYARVLRAAGAEVVELYEKADGTFPYHSPDPLVEENDEDLKKRVIAEKADLGLAIDGDGDRVFAITASGKYIDANQLLCLLAEKILVGGESLVYTVSCSSIIDQVCAELEIKSVMTPVGHSFVENKMSEIGANLGGEQSGHFFVAKNYFHFDDALFTALHICELVAKSPKTLDEMVEALPKAYTLPELRLTCPDDKKFEIVKKITAILQQKYPCETMDGVRADMGEGAWVGIRASNTSPCISVILEAGTEQKLAEINQEIDKLLAEFSEIER